MLEARDDPADVPLGHVGGAGDLPNAGHHGTDVRELTRQEIHGQITEALRLFVEGARLILGKIPPAHVDIRHGTANPAEASDRARMAIASGVISRDAIATPCPARATFSAMDSDTADLPMAGRPPRMVSSPGKKPGMMPSNVEMPDLTRCE